jgi:hypothetical protein
LYVGFLWGPSAADAYLWGFCGDSHKGSAARQRPCPLNPKLRPIRQAISGLGSQRQSQVPRVPAPNLLRTLSAPLSRRRPGCSALVAAVDSEHRRNDRDLSAQGWRPDGQPATHASAQQDDRVAQADADNDAAVAAYRLSVQVGNPFSERKLAQTFGRTSRRWARARIAEARQSLTEREPAGPASIADGFPNVATERALGLAFRYGR